MTDIERNLQEAQLSGVEEEVEDEETAESENGDENEIKPNVSNSGPVGRLVTLQNLLGAGILQPGPGAMTIDYLGQKFTGDLLANGKIRSHETDRIFASPSAWAVSCKKIVNPDKRSGCGWSSIRYRGKKLDSFKNIWLMKKSENQHKEDDLDDDEMDAKTNENSHPILENEQKDVAGENKDLQRTNEPPSLQPEVNQDQQDQNSTNEQNEEKKSEEHDELTQQAPKVEQKPRIIVKHNILGNRVANHDPNILVESTTFTSLGKIQPFLITISTNAALVMDFHCHLTTSEVVGYLAGNWDVNSHNLNITHAFPCKCRLGDYESAPLIENDVRKTIKSNRLTLVGWYHSHPTAPATPSLRDIDTQLDYELRMKGSNDSTYLPCVGVICSPYNSDNATFESNIVSYWVVPPPENRIHEYGKPMMMSYSVLQDQTISHDVLLEMKKCADFYKPEKDYIKFTEILKDDTTYLEKMKISLTSKFPLNQQKVDAMWNYIEDITLSSSDKTETEILKQIIAISSAPSPSPPINEKPKFNIPNIPSPLSFKSNTSNNANNNNNNNNNNNTTSNSSSSSSSPTSSNNNSQYQKSHSKSKSSSKRSSSRENKNLASLSNYFVGSDLASALFGSGKFPMGLDPTTKSLLNLSSLSLGNMFMPPMGNYKPDPNVGLMKPPPPPSSYYSYTSSRSSSSKSSPSSTSSRSQNRNMPSTSRDMPPPNKVPKLDVHQMANFFMPPNLNKMCTITSRPSTSTSSK